MKNNKLEYKFIPSYYEWHLVDKDGRIILNILDPYAVGDGLDECETYEQVLKLCEDWYLEAYLHYQDNEDFNGVLIDIDTIPDAHAAATEPVVAMAQTLYNYYIAA